MSIERRIESLRRFCKQWKLHVQAAEKRKADLLYWQSDGLYIIVEDGHDSLPSLIAEADENIRHYQKILATMEYLRDRAIAGDDV